MAVTSAPAGTAPAAATPQPAIGYTAAASRRRSPIRRLRRRLLLTAIAGTVFAVLAALILLAANGITNDYYGQIVTQGSVSVDAAQNARADLLDNLGAYATLLAQTDQAARSQAQATAAQAWERFKNDLRISWQNRSDRTYGEFAAFDAADRASTDYAANIGAMTAAVDAGRQDDARTSFLAAYTVLNQRLLPALESGLQSDKVEFMESRYASASSTIRGWLVAVGIFSAVAFVLALVGLLLSRRMHHRYTTEIVLAAVLIAGVSAWSGFQLSRATTQAKVLVRDAYDTVAGVRDEVALLNQQSALESIAIFDPTNALAHFKEFDDLTLRYEQGLCGAQDCVNSSFLTTPLQQTQNITVHNDIPDPVRKQVLDNQNEFGLPRVPLVGNVQFPGEAVPLDQSRNSYQRYLLADRTLRQQLLGGNVQAALATASGAGRTELAATQKQLGAAHDVARSRFSSTWQSVEDAALIGAWLTLAVLVGAGLLLRGLWRRRGELTPAGVH